MRQFGYDDGSQSKSGRMSNYLFKKNVRDIQEQYGLKVTGVVTDELINAIQQPRCGKPDLPVRVQNTKLYTFVDKNLTYLLLTQFWNLANNLTNHFKLCIQLAKVEPVNVDRPDIKLIPVAINGTLIRIVD